MQDRTKDCVANGTVLYTHIQRRTTCTRARLGQYCCDSCICLWAKHNSEDTCKTMSLFVRRLNASFVECEETGLWVHMHVWEEQRVSHIQWRQTGHQ